MPASRPLMGLLIFFVAVLVAGSVYADTVILNTGEAFTTSHAWEAGEKIRFNMHGLIVSVNRADVATLISGPNGQSDPSEKNTPPSAAAPPENRLPDFAATEPHPGATTSPSKNKEKQPSPGASTSIHGTGIQNLDWEATPDSIPGLVKIKTDPLYGGIDQYHRPDENLRIGTARLDGIVYGFWRNQLYTIMFWANGRPGYLKLAETVRTHYGGGTPSTTGQERYVWLDRDTDRMLEFDKQLNTGIFWMRSHDLQRQINRLYPQ
jgi:hypothetical protein